MQLIQHKYIMEKSKRLLDESKELIEAYEKQEKQTRKRQKTPDRFIVQEHKN